MVKDKKIDFENKCKELLDIKTKLSNINTDFSESLRLYADGIEIAKECIQYLESVKGEFNELKKKAQKVELIKKDESNFIEN